MSIKPKLIIAAAGAGKSTHLVDLIGESLGDRILVTTYTDSNTDSIERKVLCRFGYIPPNLTIVPWLSFLLRDGVRPYQGKIINKRIANMHFVGMQRSAMIKRPDGRIIQIPDNKRAHYFNPFGKIYSDKLAKFSCKIDDFHEGASIDRICKLYNHIFIDEVQDLNGYDLDFLYKIAKKCKHFVMVGDVRQVAYVTHPDQKYKKYKNGRIREYFLDKCKDVEVEIDETSLSVSYRCCPKICEIANKVYSNMPSCTSGNKNTTSHDGVFFVTEEDVDEYRELYNPQILRYSDSDKKEDNSINFGASKGLEFERVLIYPTKSIRQWFFDHNTYLEEETRAKLYIALTRARQSVGVVVPSKALKKCNALPLAVWNNEPSQSLFNLFED